VQRVRGKRSIHRAPQLIGLVQEIRSGFHRSGEEWAWEHLLRAEGGDHNAAAGFDSYNTQFDSHLSHTHSLLCVNTHVDPCIRNGHPGTRNLIMGSRSPVFGLTIRHLTLCTPSIHRRTSSAKSRRTSMATHTSLLSIRSWRQRRGLGTSIRRDRCRTSRQSLPHQLRGRIPTILRLRSSISLRVHSTTTRHITRSCRHSSTMLNSRRSISTHRRHTTTTRRTNN
jgi:hypothetical protein